MYSILGILIVAIGIIIYEVPSLIKRRLIKELWVFSILLIFGVFLSIVESMNIEVSNPSEWLETIYSPFNRLLDNILK